MLEKFYKLADTHCHIDLYPNPQHIVSQLEAHQIYTIAVTNTPSVFRYSYELSQKSEYILPAIGLHPELAVSRKQELEMFWQWLEKTRFVGEIGLDYVTRDESERNLQKGIFRKILEKCAVMKDKIITIHSRRAASDVIEMVGEGYPGTIILHWFSGTMRQLEVALEYNFYFSVNLAMLRSQKGRQIISKIPISRLLLETDGPFVQASGRPSQPTDVFEIAASLSEIWSLTNDDTVAQLKSNFSKLLN